MSIEERLLISALDTFESIKEKPKTQIMMLCDREQALREHHNKIVGDALNAVQSGKFTESDIDLAVPVYAGRIIEQFDDLKNVNLLYALGKFFVETALERSSGNGS